MALTKDPREFIPFVSGCKERGIQRTSAYALAEAGLLETFLIGRRRFIYLDSLLTLPARLAQAANDSGDLPPMDGAA